MDEVLKKIKTDSFSSLIRTKQARYQASYYKSLLKVVRVCGYPTPWLVETVAWRRFFNVLHKLLFILNAYMLGCVIASYGFVRSMAEMTSLSVSGPLSFCAVLTNIYFLWYKQDFLDMVKNLDDLFLTIQKSPIGRPDLLVKRLHNHTRFVTLLSQISVFGIGIAAIFFICPIPLPGIERDAFPLPLLTGFHGTEFRSDAVSIAWKATTLAITACKKTALDCFFITLFRMQVMYSKHLAEIMRSLPGTCKTNSDEEMYPKISEWIRLHQKLDRNNRDLISLYAPVIIMYYVNLLTIFASSIFILLSNEATDVIQGTMDILWLLSLLGLLYLQSTAADDLFVESEKMAVGLYSLPFYNLGKKSGKTIQFAIHYINRPILVTAYKAQVFAMKRESFLGFITSVVSCYITFSKMDASL